MTVHKGPNAKQGVTGTEITRQPMERQGFVVAQMTVTHPPRLLKMLCSEGEQKPLEKRRHAISLVAGNTQGKKQDIPQT